MSNPVHVFLCTDDNGMDYVLVAVSSLLAAAKPGTGLRLHLVTFGEISAEHRTRLERIVCARQDTSLAWHDADEPYNRNADIFARTGGTWHRAIWGRFFIAEFLPDFDGNVLYLDTDILVCDDLGELVAVDLGDCVLGAVAEGGLESDGGRHFNSGVLVLNLSNFRRHGGLDALLSFLRRQPGALKAPDQEALNAVFRDKVKYLHPRWNYNDCWVTRQLRFCLFAKWWNGNLPQEMFEAILHPAIIHFIGRQRKPFSPNHRPARRLYNQGIVAVGLEPPDADAKAWFHELLYAVCRFVAFARFWLLRACVKFGIIRNGMR